ncbi:MAG: rhodanese-like domain-containing protein [Candidatus Zixiibacteriota bacterium]
MRTQLNLSDILLKTALIILIGSAMGLIYNAVSPGGIALKGNWSPKITSDSLVVPYGYEEDVDPPAISLDYAMMKFQSKNTVFLDARYPEDFKAGHIKGAVNLPYEESEEYAPQVLPKLPREEEIIAYCDGTECEESLLLARELRELGYENIKVFFGGWQEWQQAGLPIETGE